VLDQARLLRWEVVLVVAIALALLVMPQLRLSALHASFYDLGQYATIVNAVAVLDDAGMVLRSHVHLLIMPYAWIYRLFPSAETLLFLQSLVLIAGAYLAGRTWEQCGAGRLELGALVYLLSLPIWFNALFDFHFDHLVFPLLLAALLATESRDKRAPALVFLLGLGLCGVKEVYALSSVGLGLYYSVVKRQWGAGGLLTLVSVGYFWIVTAIILPFYSEGKVIGEIWSGAFGHLGDTPGAMAIAILSRPWVLVAEVISSPRKIFFFLAIGLSFAFVGLKKPLILLPALPIILITLLSRNPNHAYLGHHHSIGIFPPLFFATALVIGEMVPARRDFWSRAVLCGSVAVLVLMGPAPISRLFVFSSGLNYGASSYVPTTRDRWVGATIAAHIPVGPGVVVSTQNTVFVPHLGRAELLVAFPEGVDVPTTTVATKGISLWQLVRDAIQGGVRRGPQHRFADWVILDLKRPWFVLDEGCAWVGNACTDQTMAETFNSHVRGLDRTFDQVVNADGLLIYRRRRG